MEYYKTKFLKSGGQTELYWTREVGLECFAGVQQLGGSGYKLGLAALIITM